MSWNASSISSSGMSASGTTVAAVSAGVVDETAIDERYRKIVLNEIHKNVEMRIAKVGTINEIQCPKVAE